MRQEMDSFNVSYQQTPAGNHGRNAAERAIQTFKSHFIVGLSTTHPNFPLKQWDMLLPQAVLTLNLLRPSRLHPHLSAHHMVYGSYDYSSHPIAPPGMYTVQLIVEDQTYTTSIEVRKDPRIEIEKETKKLLH